MYWTTSGLFMAPVPLKWGIWTNGTITWGVNN